MRPRYTAPNTLTATTATTLACARPTSRMLPAPASPATIAQADVYLPSLDEAKLLFGFDEPQAVIAHAQALGARAVAVKMGAHGAMVSDGSTIARVPAPSVRAVDATGAGDCFAGVLAAPARRRA